MNSVRITGKGTFDFGQMPRPSPRPDQLLIKVDSVMLNPSDILFMKGLYAIKVNYPYTPGWEGAGVVESVGNKVPKDMVGRRVAFNKQFEIGTFHVGGAFADYCVTNIQGCIPIPDNIELEQGSAFFINPLTALGMVDRLIELKAKSVIVTAASSQIARMILKLCDKNGIQAICTVRRSEQAEHLRTQLGQKYVVCTSDKDYKKQLGMICLKLKPTACLECVAGETTGEMLRFMNFGSTLILYGLLSEKPAGGIHTIEFLGKNQTIESFLLTYYLANKSPAEYVEFIGRAEALYDSDFATVIQKRYGLHQIEEAIQFYQKYQTNGKVILKPALTENKAKL